MPVIGKGGVVLQISGGRLQGKAAAAAAQGADIAVDSIIEHQRAPGLGKAEGPDILGIPLNAAQGVSFQQEVLVDPGHSGAQLYPGEAAEGIGRQGVETAVGVADLPQLSKVRADEIAVALLIELHPEVQSPGLVEVGHRGVHEAWIGKAQR